MVDCLKQLLESESLTPFQFQIIHLYKIALIFYKLAPIKSEKKIFEKTLNSFSISYHTLVQNCKTLHLYFAPIKSKKKILEKIYTPFILKSPVCMREYWPSQTFHSPPSTHSEHCPGSCGSFLRGSSLTSSSSLRAWVRNMTGLWLGWMD